MRHASVALIVPSAAGGPMKRTRYCEPGYFPSGCSIGLFAIQSPVIFERSTFPALQAALPLAAVLVVALPPDVLHAASASASETTAIFFIGLPPGIVWA